MIAKTTKPFLVVGRAGMDLYADPPGARAEYADKFVATLGGSAGNIAAALRRQGCDASLVTCVSDDAVGRFTTNQLADFGIGGEYVRKVGGQARNTLALVETVLEDFQSVIYRNDAADFHMSVEQVEAVDYSRFGALVTAGTVFAAEPSRTAAFRAMELAKAAGLQVVFDVDYRPYSWPSDKVAEDVLSRAGELSDLVVGNDEEFGFMAGGIDKGLDYARQLAQNIDLVIYKLGPEGSVTLTKDKEFTTPIYKVDALKPVGAGDAFMGGLLSSLAKGEPLELAVQKGSASAAIVVAGIGCAPAMPTPDQLSAFMSQHA